MTRRSFLRGDLGGHFGKVLKPIQFEKKKGKVLEITKCDSKLKKQNH